MVDSLKTILRADDPMAQLGYQAAKNHPIRRIIIGNQHVQSIVGLTRRKRTRHRSGHRLLDTEKLFEVGDIQYFAYIGIATHDANIRSVTAGMVTQ